MSKYGLLCSFFLLAVVMTSCSPIFPIGNAPQPLPSPSADWSLKLTQSGGFAGVNMTVQISSDGRLTAQDQRTGKTVSQTLPKATLTKLMQLYSAMQVGTPNVPHSGCADCFNYSLDLTSAGRTIHLQADDTTLASSGAADLIAYVRQLRDQALK